MRVRGVNASSQNVLVLLPHFQYIHSLGSPSQQQSANHLELDLRRGGVECLFFFSLSLSFFPFFSSHHHQYILTSMNLRCSSQNIHSIPFHSISPRLASFRFVSFRAVVHLLPPAAPAISPLPSQPKSPHTIPSLFTYLLLDLLLLTCLSPNAWAKLLKAHQGRRRPGGER